MPHYYTTVTMNAEISNENPLRKANFVNKFFFWWLKGIIKYAEKNDLSPDDIYDTMPEDLSERLRYPLEMAWEKEKWNAKKLAKPSLTKAIVKTYYKTFLKFTSLQALYAITLMIQPLLLEKNMLYFNSTSRMPTWEVYIYATISIVLMASQTAVFRHSNFHLNRLGMQIKVAISSLIYKKITKLSCSLTNGNKNVSAISLLSIDVARFDSLLFCLAQAFTVPLQLIGASYFIYSYVGLLATVIGVALMILQTIPLQALYYKLALKWRAKQTTNTDKRISLIDEIVTGVRLIKMYVWESHFEKLSYQARRSEIKGFMKISYLYSAVDSLRLISHRVSWFVVTVVYFLEFRMPISEKVFSVKQHLHNLRTSLSVYLFASVQTLADARVSIKRIENFLCAPEIKSSIKKTDGIESPGTVLLKNVTASWDDTTEDTVLCDISISFLPGKLYTVVGTTGSGNCEVSISGGISYASQEPWLFAASVRENILFGEVYNTERYNEVIKACALEDDLSNLPHGDQTMVGDRGMSLSGGQRARINLARAVYRQADIYLLDDPFSAVDTRVIQLLRSKCIDRFLKNKTVILVTHNMHHLCNEDHIVSLQSGKVQFQGSILDFQKNNEHLQFVPLEEIDCGDCLDQMTNQESGVNSDELEILRNDKKAPKENEETIIKGSLSKIVFLKYIKAGGFFGLLIALAVHTLSTASLFKFDYQITFWTEEESNDFRNQTTEYKGSVYQRILTMSWDNIHNSQVVMNSTYILALIVVTIVFKNILMYRFLYTANTKLYKRMFKHLIRTSMRFFEVNPTGRILNRFSEDVSKLDNDLSRLIMELMSTVFTVFGSLVFILLINWWNVAPIALTALLFVKMSCVYVAAIPKIKRLLATAKSPVLNFATSSLAGLTTIRSCKAENFVIKEFAGFLDKHTAVFFLSLASSMAFVIWMETVTIGLFACTAYICIALKNTGVLGGEAGLTLTTIYEITSYVSYMVRMYAETCAQMVNVERILQYTELEPEDFGKKESDHLVLESWPHSGEIKFEQVNLKYSEEEEPVLKNLRFFIEPGAKVGIVGRTGAGKSSLITSLFRLAQMEGQILIDSVDTQKVDLSRLRSKISIIPQEPILFSASLRSNLDPYNEFDDATLWLALDNVGLRNAFTSLDQLIEKSGKNLSLGQRQLLCLARVAIKKNKILVLDEATANVDTATDALIQDAIKDKFKNCTVLTIAHRLNTIMDSDKVLVMDHGQVIEYDHPYFLLQNRDGHFSYMVEQTGERMSRELKSIAENAYSRRQRQ